MKKIFKFIFDFKWTIMTAVLILGGCSYYVYSNNINNSIENQVKTDLVQTRDIKVSVNGSGQIQAENQVDLTPQIAGDGLDIVEVVVENDQEVKEGDLIAILDSDEAEEKIRDAKLNLTSAEIQYKETAKLYDNKTSEDTWKRDLAQNTVNQKMNDLNDAYEDLEEYKIKAPFDGIVTGLKLDAGDSVSRSDTLASVITKTLQAEISLNELDSVKITKGSPAILHFDVLDGEEITGKVSKIDTIGSANSGVVSYDVVVAFDSSSELLKPGMSVEVDIEVANVQGVLTVPVAAIQEDKNGEEYVMIVASDSETSFIKKSVKTGLTDDVYTEIISGLEEGDEVVTQALSSASTSGSSSSNKNASKSIFQMGGGKPPQ